MPKRDRIDIIENILFLLSHKKMKPTHLMYKSNLSHAQMKNYLHNLEKKGFITRNYDDKNNNYLKITIKGIKFLEKIREMKEFEKTFGLEK